MSKAYNIKFARMRTSNALSNLLVGIIIISTYLAITKLPLFNDIGKFFTLFKDVFLLLIILLYMMTQYRKLTLSLKLDRVLVLTFVYFIICFIYTIFSPLKVNAFVGLIALIYGPLLYLLTRYSTLSNKNIINIVKTIFYFLYANIAAGLVVQLLFYDSFCELLGIHNFFQESGSLGNIFRHTASGESIARLIGLSISPAETASICLMLTLFASVVIHNYVFRVIHYSIILVTFYLTYARSPFVGILGSLILYYVIKLRGIKSILVILLLIGSSVLATYVLYNNIYTIMAGLDVSALIHVYDTFIGGPKYVVENWYGLGVGMAGVMATRSEIKDLDVVIKYFESDHYNTMLQIGIIGFIVYASILYVIIKIMHEISTTTDNRYLSILSNRTKLFFTSLIIGGFLFPLMSTSRLITNLVWILSALVIKYNYNITQEQK